MIFPAGGNGLGINVYTAMTQNTEQQKRSCLSFGYILLEENSINKITLSRCSVTVYNWENPHFHLQCLLPGTQSELSIYWEKKKCLQEKNIHVTWKTPIPTLELLWGFGFVCVLVCFVFFILLVLCFNIFAFTYFVLWQLWNQCVKCLKGCKSSNMDRGCPKMPKYESQNKFI